MPNIKDMLNEYCGRRVSISPMGTESGELIRVFNNGIELKPDASIIETTFVTDKGLIIKILKPTK